MTLKELLLSRGITPTKVENSYDYFTCPKCNSEKSFRIGGAKSDVGICHSCSSTCGTNTALVFFGIEEKKLVPKEKILPFTTNKYLTKKGISAQQQKNYESLLKCSEKGYIVIPINNIAGKQIGIQYINQAGAKWNRAGSTVSGGLLILSEKEQYAVCEGIATAMTIDLHTDYSGVVCFGKSNCEYVTTALMKTKNKNVIALPDVDVETPVLNGVKLDLKEKGISDWNDVFKIKGCSFFKKFFNKSIELSTLFSYNKSDEPWKEQDMETIVHTSDTKEFFSSVKPILEHMPKEFVLFATEQCKTLLQSMKKCPGKIANPAFQSRAVEISTTEGLCLRKKDTSGGYYIPLFNKGKYALVSILNYKNEHLGYNLTQYTEEGAKQREVFIDSDVTKSDIAAKELYTTLYRELILTQEYDITYRDLANAISRIGNDQTPSVKLLCKRGWQEIEEGVWIFWKDKTNFISRNTIDIPTGVQVDHTCMSKLQIKEFCDKDPYFFFMFCLCGFGTHKDFLTTKYNEFNVGCAVHIKGITGSGKTTLMRLAMALHGKSEVTNMSNTKNSTINQLGEEDCVFLDETETMEKDFEDKMKTLLYSVTSGTEKDRMTKDCKVMKGLKIRATLVTTGERSLLSMHGQAGLFRRVIEIVPGKFDFIYKPSECAQYDKTIRNWESLYEEIVSLIPGIDRPTPVNIFGTRKCPEISKDVVKTINNVAAFGCKVYEEIFGRPPNKEMLNKVQNIFSFPAVKMTGDIQTTLDWKAIQRFFEVEKKKNNFLVYDAQKRSQNAYGLTNESAVGAIFQGTNEVWIKNEEIRAVLEKRDNTMPTIPRKKTLLHNEFIEIMDVRRILPYGCRAMRFTIIKLEKLLDEEELLEDENDGIHE